MDNKGISVSVMVIEKSSFSSLKENKKDNLSV